MCFIENTEYLADKKNTHSQTDRPSEKERVFPAFLSHESIVVSILTICCDTNHSYFMFVAPCIMPH